MAIEQLKCSGDEIRVRVHVHVCANQPSSPDKQHLLLLVDIQ